VASQDVASQDVASQDVASQDVASPDVTEPGDDEPTVIAPLPGEARTVVVTRPAGGADDNKTRQAGLAGDKTTRLPPPPAWPAHPPAAADESTLERERSPLPPAAPGRAAERPAGGQTPSAAPPGGRSQAARADSLADIESAELSRDDAAGDESARQEAPAGPPDDGPTVATSVPPLIDEGDETMRLRPPPVIPARPSRASGREKDAGIEPPARDAAPGTGPGGEARATVSGGDGRGIRPGGESRGVGPSAESLEAVISERAPATSVAGDPATVPPNDLEHTEPAAADAAASDAEPGPTDATTPDATRPDAKTRKLSSAGALIWVLLALFGFTLVVQLRSNSADDGLATARQEDLVRILSDLEARDQRLQSEINTLETSRQQLTSGVQGRQAALAEAQKRADELGLLAGTLPGRGTGLRIVIDPRGAKVKASAVLNAVQELRGAGGEVMQIVGTDGAAVRIVASTYFVDVDNGGIVVDGRRLTGPWTLLVIGQPQTMQTALQIPGGVVASVNSAGGSVTMEARSMVEVTAVRKATSLQYARPVS
jgi:uncharacterized protein YlxW (UPF0749 family)